MKYILFNGISDGKVAIDRIGIWGMEECTVNGQPCTTLLTHAAKVSVTHSLEDVLERLENYDETASKSQIDGWRERSKAMEEGRAEFKAAAKDAEAMGIPLLGKLGHRSSKRENGKVIFTLEYADNTGKTPEELKAENEKLRTELEDSGLL